MNTANRLIVLIHDKDKEQPVINRGHFTEEYLKEKNKQGYGIFETANEFSGHRRTKVNLSKLRVVYADIDICKDSDNLPEAEREARKEQVIIALNGYCEPTSIVVTKNGIQPRWAINEPHVDEATQEKYSHVIEGVIEWTKPHGNLGDPVKDVTRLLRKPGYYHQKSSPYLVMERPGSGKIYTLDELKSFFWNRPEQAMQQKQKSQDIENPAYPTIEELDIKQVVIDVWAELGHRAEFNENGQLIIDDQLTATFKGRLGDGNYMATTSADYPAKGNAVTYVAETLKVSNKEAFKWLLRKYNLEKDPEFNKTSKNVNKNEKYQELKDIFIKDQKIGAYEITKYFIAKYTIHTIDGKKDRELYLYKDGIYITGTSIVRQEVENILEELASIRIKNEIIDKIKDRTRIERTAFEVDFKFINLHNGILNVETREFLPHSPNYLFTFQLPVCYELKADCSKIKGFLKDVLHSDDVLIFQEWVGFCIYRRYFIKKALICVGEKDTGKTTLLNIVTEFIGTKNISGVSLQKLASDKFAAANMYQKHVNLYDDLSKKDINDNGEFKMATGNGYIPGEFKFGDQFMFRNYAKLIYACNKIPSAADTNDDAYFARWIVMEFNRPIPEDKMDKQLLVKLTTPEELSGLLNWGLEGLTRLLEKQSFSYTKDPDAIKVQMLRSGSDIANFAYDCLRKATDDDGENNWISKEEMYEKFITYAQARDLPIVTIIDFGKKLPKYSTYINDGKKSIDNSDIRGKKQHTGWRNVCFKTNNEIPLP